MYLSLSLPLQWVRPPCHPQAREIRAPRQALHLHRRSGVEGLNFSLGFRVQGFGSLGDNYGVGLM